MKDTSGGRFDPNDPFLYFLAGGADRFANDGYDYPYVLVAVNELFTAGRRESLDKILDDPNRKVLLDSGIFNLTNGHAKRHDMTMDMALSMAPDDIDGFDRLWDNFGEIATQYQDRLWGIIELDQGGKTYKPHTRARIEQDFGIIPMPVLHPLLDGWDYYDDLAENYDRICVGNIVQASPPVRMRLIHALYEHAHGHLNTWHHLLGYTPNELLHSLPIRGSADSSSWLTGLRWMPSWKGFAAAKAMSNYPSTMWYNAAEEGSYNKANAVAYGNAVSLGYGVTDFRESMQP